MRSSTIPGGPIGTAIDGADGDDGTAGGALIGAGVVTAARILAPIAVTFVAGWLVLRGLGELTDKVLGVGDADY